MAVSQVNTFTGLYTYLKANSTFNTAMGGGVATAGRIWYGHVERDDEFPYCMIDMISSTFSDTMQKDGYDYRVQITIYEDVEAGPSALMGHMDKLRTRLHGQRITATGQQTMTVVEDTLRGPFRDDDAWRVDADYLVRGFVS